VTLDELIRKLTEKGIDVNEVLLEALSREDPDYSSEERIKFAESYLKESYEYLNKGDPVQASEKAYKAAEEVVKALAEKFRTQEYQAFMREGMWYSFVDHFNLFHKHDMIH